MPKNFLNSASVSEENLSIALAQVKLGFWELDLATKLITCTEQNRANLGLTADQVITENTIIEAILPEDRWRRVEGLKRAMHPKTPTYDFEIRVKHPSQAIRWLQVRGTVIFEARTPVRIIGTTVDISEKKGMEILRDELLNITTHELKSPLSVVKGYLQLIYKFIAGTGDTKHLLIAERAINASSKVERLIEEIIHPSAHSESEILLKKETFDLRKLVLEVISNTKVISEAVEIKLITLTDVYYVTADRYRIAQVLTNLINNAIKYAPGESLIVIEISSDSSNVKISIIDMGIGIPDHEREKIFGKFYRIKNSSSVAAGSGIGLFLCSEIIARHGGAIGMRPNPTGKGTLAFFSLPIIKS
ncbi:PAS domain S-box-containing protein [Pedobacter terrae]|uniref:histidine kinase n=1 Tax=Pedobacter terrae TaxID=405671 RepID=A0A1G7WAK6_9SPHI|nr:PAS domain-containing sensor histidine kinase [Pedobacter terrae]SDG69026.1 PAS domain S-box-containing protein [Pedobacter terrae]